MDFTLEETQHLIEQLTDTVDKLGTSQTIIVIFFVLLITGIFAVVIFIKYIMDKNESKVSVILDNNEASAAQAKDTEKMLLTILQDTIEKQREDNKAQFDDHKHMVGDLTKAFNHNTELLEKVTKLIERLVIYEEQSEKSFEKILSEMENASDKFTDQHDSIYLSIFNSDKKIDNLIKCMDTCKSMSTKIIKE